MIIDKLHKREIHQVFPADTEGRKPIVVKDAKTNTMLTTWKLIKDLDLEPGDKITVDVRILVERGN